MWALRIETELSFKEQLDQLTSQADNSDELQNFVATNVKLIRFDVVWPW